MEPLGASSGPLTRRDLAALAVLGLFAAAGAQGGSPPKLFQHIGLRGAFEDPYQPEATINPLETRARALLESGM